MLRLPNLEGQVPLFITTGTKWPRYTLSHWVPFSSPLTTSRATVELFELPPRWVFKPCQSLLRQSQSQNYITTDGQSASLSWRQSPIWDPRPNFLLLSLIIFRQLHICWCGAPSLTRGRVCSLHLLMDLACRTYDHIFTVSNLILPQSGEQGSCIYLPQEQDNPGIPLQTAIKHSSLFFSCKRDCCSDCLAAVVVYRVITQQRPVL
jgi:hypothetical protein